MANYNFPIQALKLKFYHENHTENVQISKNGPWGLQGPSGCCDFNRQTAVFGMFWSPNSKLQFATNNVAWQKFRWCHANCMCHVLLHSLQPSTYSIPSSCITLLLCLYLSTKKTLGLRIWGPKMHHKTQIGYNVSQQHLLCQQPCARRLHGSQQMTRFLWNAYGSSRQQATNRTLALNQLLGLHMSWP